MLNTGNAYKAFIAYNFRLISLFVIIIISEYA